MTQKREAKAGVITPEMKVVAEKEQVDPQWLRDKVGEGRIVIPANPNHRGLSPCGVGEGLFIKVNANIEEAEREILSKSAGKKSKPLNIQLR